MRPPAGSAVTSTAEGFSSRVDSAVSTLNPGYFALVMSTGIVSVAVSLQSVPVLPEIMLVITAVSWVLLTVLTAVRIARHRPRFALDFRDPRRGFGFFTFTAASGVLGTLLATHGYWGWAVPLLVVTAASWLVLGYVVPWTAVLNPSHRPTLPGANGTWFIWCVASQSVAVLSATVELSVDGTVAKDILGLMAVFAWGVGCFLYAGVALLVAARLMLYPLGPEDAVPAYWISMGATAISVLAGAKIILLGESAAPIVRAVRDLAAGASVTFWIFGTWLVPVLIAMGCWRHLIHKLPLRYDATLWSVIFPLGMYSVASHFLASEEVDDLPIVMWISNVEVWVALAAWAAVFAWMCVHLWRTLILGHNVPPQPERPYPLYSSSDDADAAGPDGAWTGAADPGATSPSL